MPYIKLLTRNPMKEMKEYQLEDGLFLVVRPSGAWCIELETIRHRKVVAPNGSSILVPERNRCVEFEAPHKAKGHEWTDAEISALKLITHILIPNI